MSEWIEEAEELAPRRLYDGRLFRRLLGFLRPHWKLAGAAVVLIILSSLLQLVGPLATAVALDLFVRPAGGEEVRLTAVSKAVATQLEERALEVDPEVGIAVAGGVYLGALLASFLVLYVQSYLMQLMGQFVMFDLRREIFSHLQRLPVSYFDRQPLGEPSPKLSAILGVHDVIIG